ncbi:MAG: hypothetical protein LBU80_02250 [Rikenellaceae bacterium]|jgi:hypothetical protein|nr:hypothetical protein [Rikenellaceae bacterium]
MHPRSILPANVLPAVLVIAALMGLVIAALLGLLEIGTAGWREGFARRQQEACLDAAFLLWECDSTLIGRLDTEGGFLVFDDDPRSQVVLSSCYWGLYRLVGASTADEKTRAMRLMGQACESPLEAALYACDNFRAFTLAGRSNFRGPIYLPGKKLLYGQVQSDFYAEEPVSEEEIRASKTDFPEPCPGIRDSLRALMLARDTASAFVGTERITRSFFEPPLFLRADTLRGVSLRGRIVVCSADLLEIDSTAALFDILAVARRVVIRSGFSGSVQVVASDTVIVEPRVRLDYPSGIVMPETPSKSHIEIGEGSEVNGYVIFDSAATSGEGQAVNYRQHPDARVRGLVWVDGIAQVQGAVTGSLYGNHLNYYARWGYYENLLYDARVYRSDAMAFPVWMEAVYRKKTIKWLH